MHDYDAFLAQLDSDRPDWPLEFAEQRDLLDALRPLVRRHPTGVLPEPGPGAANHACDLLRSRVGPRLWIAVQAHARAQALAKRAA